MKTVNLFLTLVVVALCIASASADITLSNPSFESPVGSQYVVPTGWTLDSGSTPYIYAGDVPEGGGTQILQATGSSTALYTTSVETIIDNYRGFDSYYKLSFSHKALGSGTSATVRVYAVSNPSNPWNSSYTLLMNESTALTNTSWQQFSYLFAAPAGLEGRYFLVYIMPTTTGSVWTAFDNFRLAPIADMNNLSFEEPAMSSGGTLYGEPQGWSLFSGSRANVATYRGDPPSGGGSQTLKITHSSTQLQNILGETILGGCFYNFSFSHKALSSGTSAMVKVYAVEDPSDPWSSYMLLMDESTTLTNTSWQQFSCQFVAPASADDWYFCILVAPSTTGTVCSVFDNFRLAADVDMKNLSFEEQTLPSGGAIYGGPQGWSLYAGSRANVATYMANPVDAPAGGGSQTLWLVGSDTRVQKFLAEPIIGSVPYNFSISHKMYGSGNSAGFTLYAVKDLSNPWANYRTVKYDNTTLTNTSWQQSSYRFTTTAEVDGWYFCVFLYPSSTGTVASAFDNIRITPASRLPNLSFEEPALSSGMSLYGAPQGWTLDAGSAASVCVYAGDAPIGAGTQILKFTGSTTRLGNVPVGPIKGGASYTFSFYYGAYGSGNSAGVTLYAVKDPKNPWVPGNYTALASKSTGLTSTSWVSHSLPFTAPSGVNGWRFYIWLWPSSTADVWSTFDKFQISTSTPGITHGMQWVRDHSFQIFSWTENPYFPDLDIFKGVQNTFWSRVHHTTASADARALGLFRHMNTHVGIFNPSEDLIPYINSSTTTDEDNAWHIMDEPGVGGYLNEDLEAAEYMVDWLKTNRPNSLTYISFFETNSIYMNGYIGTGIDALMWDAYAYTTHEWLPTEDPNYFDALATCRSAAKSYGMPVFAWIETFGDGYYRIPSESEFRMNVFSCLTAGYKGIGYFAYGGWTSWAAYMLNSSGVPQTIYYDAQDIKSDIHWLGNKLRFLDSTSMFFIPGPGHSTPPYGLTNWSSSGDPDPHITDISIGGSSADKKDGLIGFFTDDVGNQYFMLTNLYRSPSLSAYDARATFTVTFDNNTNTIYRLRRDTGAQETVSLTNHQLTLTLDGGTGDLFSYTGF